MSSADTTGLSTLLLKQPLLQNLAPAHLALLLGCAEAKDHQPGEWLCRNGDLGQDLILVHRGSLLVENENGRAPRPLSAGESIGWFCFLPDIRWPFDCRPIAPTTVIRLDGACVRRKCGREPELGYELARRVLFEMHKERTSAPASSPAALA